MMSEPQIYGKYCYICYLEQGAQVIIRGDTKALKRHIAIRHAPQEYRMYRCLDCNETYYDGEHYEYHLRNSNGGNHRVRLSLP